MQFQEGWPGKASVRRWQLSKDLKEMGEHCMLVPGERVVWVLLKGVGSGCSLPQSQNQARLVKRKASFISDASN